MKKISGQLITDHLASVVNTELPDKVKTIDNIECVGTFRSIQAILCYGNKENMHRPYLYLTGHITNLMGDFPCGIDSITLGSDDTMENPGPAVSFQLEFNQEELAQLCQKGLFTRQFKCPDIFVDNEFVMPFNCQCEYLEPENENDVPLLFIGIKNQHNIQMDAADTGYSLADYFEDVMSSVDEKQIDVNYNDEQVYQSDDVYYHDSDDFLFDNDDNKEKSAVSPVQSLIKQPVVQSEEEKALQLHFENVQKTVDDRLKAPSESVAVVSDVTQKADVSSDFVDFEDNNDNGVPDEIEDEIKNEIEEEFEDEQDAKSNAVAINQTENLKSENVKSNRNVPSHLADIVDTDDKSYDDLYDGDDEFI